MTELTQGDIVRTVNRQYGVVVGFFGYPHNQPQQPIVLLMRDDERFGGFEGGFVLSARTLKKVDHLDDDRNGLPNAAREWLRSRRDAA